MKFRYVIETVNKNGLTESTEKDFDKSEISIGRGAGVDLRLVNRLVSLEHAKVTFINETAYIHDLGSLSGVFLNGTLISKEKLRPGDRLKIGSFVFEVFYEPGVWGILEQRKGLGDSKDSEQQIEAELDKLKFQTYLPSFTVLSSLISIAILVAYFLLPLMGKRQGSWNSGPISNAHKMIENNCKSCHDSAFTRVKDEQCSSCHSMSEHAKNISSLYQKHPQLEARCASCHMEHNGDEAIIARDSALCADCHARIDKLVPIPQTPNISDFSKHPEFRVTIRKALQEAVGVDNSQEKTESSAIKVSLADKQNLNDPTTIKLNHKIHLAKDLAGPDGPTTLQCSSCHEASADQNNIKPINFENHCASCHGLEFDSSLPGKAVPHGDPDTVYNFLYAEYAKLFLVKEGLEDESILKRQKPGKPVTRAEQIEFSRQSVEAKSRSVEESIFTRTACHLCHEVSTVENMPEKEGVQRISKFSVVKPNVPERWMVASVFDHGAHQEVSCESCHSGVRDSEVTKDVLLPGIANCRQCHSQENKTGMVVSECVTCHSFHEPNLLPEEQKREIEKVLLSSISFGLTPTGSFLASKAVNPEQSTVAYDWSRPQADVLSQFTGLRSRLGGLGGQLVELESFKAQSK